MVEIEWETGPTTEELSFHVGNNDPVTFSGTSPVRAEFPTDPLTGTLYLDTAENVAIETFYTAKVSIFEDGVLDPEWSALS